MKSVIFISTLLIVGMVIPAVSAQVDKTVCVIYFTYIGCPNCAFTDPVVLTEWTEKYDNLVVIEYMWSGGDYRDPNSQFFGKYAMEYKTQAAVPYLSIDKDNIRMGRLDVPAGEADIEAKKSNLCPLPEKSVSFEGLDLNKLQGKPKIWANGRILISLGENTWLFQWNGEKIGEEIMGNENINNKLLKDLLFTDGISQILNGKKFESAESQKAEFSGIAFPGYDFVPYKDFENAIKIEMGTSGCPTCPGPSEWSACIGGEKTRTNHRCSAETNYECEPYEETEQCSLQEHSDLNWIIILVIPIIIIIGVGALIYKKVKFKGR
ncbi:MAG: hypothetical protein KAW40_06190 [Candidatus Aenigmarchaeota archaeon]|nr:hypothetical protein [Candidatus Aenigmarchaeota archaeon]